MPRLFSPLSTFSLSEHGGQRSHLHHLLPPVQSDAAGQAAEQGGGHQDPAVDLHQVLPGEADVLECAIILLSFLMTSPDQFRLGKK